MTLLMIAPMIASSDVQASSVEVPSGLPVTLHEVLIDEQPGEVWLRFRFVVPDLAGQDGVDAEQAAGDMDHLCDTVALPYMQQFDLSPAQIVISLSDRVVEFGTTEPDATQVFELYAPGDGACVWEGL
ncbi:MAG: DUF6497 family protein [Pseudomonadota bacterium]